MHIVNISVAMGLLISSLPDAVTNSLSTEEAKVTLEAKNTKDTKNTKNTKDAKTNTDSTNGAINPDWNDLNKTCDSIAESITKALSKHQVKPEAATEFSSDLSKIRAHIMSVKPQTGNLGFSQKLFLERDLTDLKAQIDFSIASAMHPAENIETVKAKFLAELQTASQEKKIAQADVDKLNAEVKQQEDLIKSMRRGADSLPQKDLELLSHNFACLHVSLQRKIAFSRDAVPAINNKRQELEETLQTATTDNSLTQEKLAQLKSNLAKIAAKESEELAKGGPLSTSQLTALAMEIEGLDEILKSQIQAAQRSK